MMSSLWNRLLGLFTPSKTVTYKSHKTKVVMEGDRVIALTVDGEKIDPHTEEGREIINKLESDIQKLDDITSRTIEKMDRMVNQLSKDSDQMFEDMNQMVEKFKESLR